MKKGLLQTIWDFIGIPFRLMVIPPQWTPHFKWTSMEEERFGAVLPFIQGRLLDVGAGKNKLVNRYGNGVGIDVIDWGGGTQVVKDSSNLPFPDASFDTITFLACLNHIPYRQKTIHEARRVIKPDGQLLITMINPFLGEIGHKIWWWSEEKHRGGMAEGEEPGLWTDIIIRICEAEGFALQTHNRFVYGLNNLYIFRPK